MDSDTFSLACFLFFVFGIIFSVMIFCITRPDITDEDFYRFCMVKQIPLEECKTPAKPYKSSINK